MGLIRESKNVDFVVEPHEVTEDDHLAMLAFIEACKNRKMEQQRKVAQIQRSFKQLVDA